MISASSVYFGLLVGTVPTVSMMFASLLFFNTKISSTFESTAQNFCAGLILGAVAKELFPQISVNGSSTGSEAIGITVGFFIGLFFVNFLDFFVDWVQRHMCCIDSDDDGHNNNNNNSNITDEEAQAALMGNEMSAKNMEMQRLAAASRSYQSMEAQGDRSMYTEAMARELGIKRNSSKDPVSTGPWSPNDAVLSSGGSGGRDRAISKGSNADSAAASEDSGSSAGGDQDPAIMLLASQAIASPLQRDRIRKKIADLVSSIKLMGEKSKRLDLCGSRVQNAEAELYADQIDEEIHKFQYNLDNCRRLIQGTGLDIEGVVPRLWVSQKGLKRLNARLRALSDGANGLTTAMDELDNSINSRLLHNHHHANDNHSNSHNNTDECTSLHSTPTACEPIEFILMHRLHSVIDDMDSHVEALHRTVENYSFKWGKRGKTRIIPIPESGSFIPMGLIIPVTVDCIVDGFLLGTTSAISLRAGIVLGFANCIEMGFLGLAVSVRIQKCTGSSVFARYCAVVIPPLIMLASSVLGALCGALSRAHPAVFIGFISFGIVALVYLVVNELLVEAREALEGQEQWWTAMTLFAGIYAVIVLDMIL